jgi:hypothetical protein
LEARVKQLENVQIGEPAVSVVDPKVPVRLGVFPTHAPEDPTELRKEYSQKVADIKAAPPIKPIPPATSVHQPAQKQQVEGPSGSQVSHNQVE